MQRYLPTSPRRALARRNWPSLETDTLSYDSPGFNLRPDGSLHWRVGEGLPEAEQEIVAEYPSTISTT